MKEEIKNYYNALAKDYDADRFSNSYGKYIHCQENAVLGKYLDENVTDGNLDIACGTGRFLNYAEAGIDFSEEMVAVSKRKYPAKNISVEDAESLPFESASFNNAISFHLFMHLEENSFIKILGEANRVLKKGGYFIFDIPSEKRRKLTSYKSSNWHGGNQLTVQSLKNLLHSDWELVSFYGTVFVPIHRFPRRLRNSIIRFDNFLCKSFLREYSSHLIFVLRKK